MDGNHGDARSDEFFYSAARFCESLFGNKERLRNN